MNYHIITAFSRGENMQKMVDHLARFNVIWHPVIDMPFTFPKLDWIQPYTFVKEGYKSAGKNNNIGNQAWNKYLQSGLLVDEDYYQVLPDDDFLDPDFYRIIQGVNTDIIIVSMKRGDNVTESGYGTDTLIGDPSNMRVCAIGGEQFLAKGRILKHERVINHRLADGFLIEKLWREQPRASFTFCPDAFVLFNYLEPGRWNANK